MMKPGGELYCANHIAIALHIHSKHSQTTQISLQCFDGCKCFFRSANKADVGRYSYRLHVKSLLFTGPDDLAKGLEAKMLLWHLSWNSNFFHLKWHDSGGSPLFNLQPRFARAELCQVHTANTGIHQGHALRMAKVNGHLQQRHLYEPPMKPNISH